MWVKFVVGSRLVCLIFSGLSGFPPSTKINISKFQFDWEFEGHKFVNLDMSELAHYWNLFHTTCNLMIIGQQSRATEL